MGIAQSTHTHTFSTSVNESATEGLAELLTVKEAAQFLKVTISWVYEHVRPEAEDRLPVLKLGKYLRFDIRDLRAYIDAKRAHSKKLSPPSLTSPPC